MCVCVRACCVRVTNIFFFVCGHKSVPVKTHYVIDHCACSSPSPLTFFFMHNSWRFRLALIFVFLFSCFSYFLPHLISLCDILVVARKSIKKTQRIIYSKSERERERQREGERERESEIYLPFGCPSVHPPVHHLCIVSLLIVHCAKRGRKKYYKKEKKRGTRG